MAFIRNGERRLKTLKIEFKIMVQIQVPRLRCLHSARRRAKVRKKRVTGSKKPLRMRVSVKYRSAFISIAFVQRGKGIDERKRERTRSATKIRVPSAPIDMVVLLLLLL